MYENTEDLDRLKTSSLVLTVIFSQGKHITLNVMSAIFQLLLHPHCKKSKRFSRLQPGFGHLPNSTWPGIIKIFLARERLVSDIPDGDGKIDNLLLTVPFYTAVLPTGRKFGRRTQKGPSKMVRGWKNQMTILGKIFPEWAENGPNF